MTDADLVAAAHALGARDVAALPAGGIVMLRTVLRDAQRMRWEAFTAAVALDALFPRPGCTWRAVCCLCVDALDVADSSELEAHRVNRDTGHDTGCCSFCGYAGRNTLVAAVPDATFRAGICR